MRDGTSVCGRPRQLQLVSKATVKIFNFVKNIFFLDDTSELKYNSSYTLSRFLQTALCGAKNVSKANLYSS